MPLFVAITALISNAEARVPRGRVIEGVLRQVNTQEKSAVIIPHDGSKPLPVTWIRRTGFFRASQQVTAAELQNGIPVKVCRHVPLLTPPYVDKVTILDGPEKLSPSK